MPEGIYLAQLFSQCLCVSEKNRGSYCYTWNVFIIVFGASLIQALGQCGTMRDLSRLRERRSELNELDEFDELKTHFVDDTLH